jgi:pimeloyl-ACP methyl ester carboxylesterase
MDAIPPPARRRPRLGETLAEFRALAFQRPAYPRAALLEAAPRGDGHAVLVLPALLTSDAATRRVRDFLAALGYAAEGWGLGIDWGPTPRLMAGARARLGELAARHGQVSLLGYSMGGLFARWLAQQDPGAVRQVISVCAPLREPLRHFFLPPGPLVRLWRGVDIHALAAEVARPLPVPGAAIYSRNDGIVHWTSCLDPALPAARQRAIAGAHMLIMADPAVMALVAELLAPAEALQPMHDPS